MNIEQIQKFITAPELPDIISYLILIAVFIVECFVKKFVEKDNKNTILSVNSKTSEMAKLKKELLETKQELIETKQELIEERLKFGNEKKELLSELSLIKDAIKTSSNNSQELVSNGTANYISKMLSKNKENKEKNKNE